MYSAGDTLAGGLPHSDIHGSTPARGSPWLFAACHVLHRLLVPRHPPNALLILDIPNLPPKAQASPCTETILREPEDSFGNMCFRTHRHSRTAISPDCSRNPKKDPSDNIVHNVSEPSSPTVGGPLQLECKHSSDQAAIPGQTSQPNDGTSTSPDGLIPITRAQRRTRT